jgi:dihydrodipicolinate synthase/N-acetylneuraminate lyase
MVNSKLKIAVLVFVILIPVTTWLRMMGRWDEKEPGFNKDLYDHKTILQNASDKEDLIVVGNDESRFIWFYHLDRKGWCFAYNNLETEKLAEMIKKGAKYLYSDSRKVDENLLTTPYLDSLIIETGSIRVYSLKTLR